MLQKITTVLVGILRLALLAFWIFQQTSPKKSFRAQEKRLGEVLEDMG